jgi:hypothetical protein
MPDALKDEIQKRGENGELAADDRCGTQAKPWNS